MNLTVQDVIAVATLATVLPSLIAGLLVATFGAFTHHHRKKLDETVEAIKRNTEQLRLSSERSQLQGKALGTVLKALDLAVQMQGTLHKGVVLELRRGMACLELMSDDRKSRMSAARTLGQLGDADALQFLKERRNIAFAEGDVEFAEYLASPIEELRLSLAPKAVGGGP